MDQGWEVGRCDWVGASSGREESQGLGSWMTMQWEIGV